MTDEFAVIRNHFMAEQTEPANRRIEPQKLSVLMRGELDWIVMKALEKDRARRYETANGFAEDVRRYLDNEPVLACPPSRTYRARKFIHRNKVYLTASALVFMALIAGIAGTGWQAYRATQAERRSLEKERDAIRSAQKAMAAADESKRSLMKAREAVDRLLTRVAVDLRDMPHMAQTRRALLLDALEFYQGFLEQQRNNPSLRRETAMLHWRVSDIFHELGQIEQSMPHVKEAIRLLKELVREKPDNQGYRNDLVQRYAILRSNLMALSLTEERLIATSESIAVAEQLVADFPSVPHYRIEAAKGYLSQSHIYSGLNDMPKTLAGCRSAIAIIEQLMHDFPDEATQALAFEPRCATTPSGSQPDKVRNMEYFPEQGSLEKHSIPGRLACRNLSGCE